MFNWNGKLGSTVFTSDKVMQDIGHYRHRHFHCVILTGPAFPDLNQLTMRPFIRGMLSTRASYFEPHSGGMSSISDEMKWLARLLISKGVSSSE